jgi:YfiH family protein
MTDWLESAEAIGAVDKVLAGVGLEHGRRASLAGTWKAGERVKLPKGKTANSSKEKGSISNKSLLAGLISIPAWSGYPWLAAGFSTREGGASTAYGEAEQNLGWTRDDDEANVAANRRRFVAAAASGEPVDLVTVRQFHSGMVRIIEPDQIESGQTPFATPTSRAVLRGDALVTAVPGLLLGIQTADCVPVLLADIRNRAVAAFHAGWRGTLARIVERGVGTMRLRHGSRPVDIVAAIGPAIGPCCFAVGEEVRHEFESQFAYAPQLFSEVYDSDPVREKYPLLFLTARAPGHSNIGPQIHLDLFEANRRQLLDAGIPAKAITVIGECSACTRLPNGRRKYFSHRAEHGYTGRMLSVIGVKQPLPKKRTRKT